MGLETGTAILLSTLFGAGASAVQGQQSRAAQGRLAREQAEKQRRLATEKRIASAKDIESERQAKIAADRLSKAKGMQVSGSALAQKGIQKRPVASFADISKAVLDEGNV